jgi:pyridoxal phosphate enzyme (YggS family)
MSIAENIAAIRSRMTQAAVAAGRDPEKILLCAATKMDDADAVREAIRCGVDCCGENKVQELTQKLQHKAYTGAPVHFIGHLQTNKVRQVVGKVSLIQSVDREKLLLAVSQEAQKQRIVQDILLQVNVGREESKSGFLSEEVLPLLEHIGEFPNIFVRGLMAIPPISKKIGDNRKFFQEILQLSVDISAKKYDNVTVECLSMGMSDDFEEAILCGSTMIRVGTAIFGARDYTMHHNSCDVHTGG